MAPPNNAQPNPEGERDTRRARTQGFARRDAPDPEARRPMRLARAHGFSLSSVCWGYRDTFRRTIEGLVRQGLIGRERPQVTEHFFDLLQRADQSCFDHVLKEFLASVNPRTRWLLDLPGLFAEVTDTGRRFAEKRLHYGIEYFRILGEGGFGETPPQVRHLLRLLGELRAVDDELAFAFLKGYRGLLDRLRPREIDRFVQEGLRHFAGDRTAAMGYFDLSRQSAETMILSLTRECRLEDAKERLQRLLRALTGRGVEVDHLGRLDSDELIERNARMVCLYQWLYLPVRVRHFEDIARNRDVYRLAAVVAAGMLAEGSFPAVHGHAEYPTCAALVGSDPVRLNLFQALECGRVFARIRARWPGARGLLRFGLRVERETSPPRSDADRLLFDLLEETGDAQALAGARRVMSESVNCFDTAARLDEGWTRNVLRAYPDLGGRLVRTSFFLPDFLYPGATSSPPPESVVADLKDAALQSRSEEAPPGEQADRADVPSASEQEQEEAEQTRPGAQAAAAFLYDEWSQTENTYYEGYCRVREVRDLPGRGRFPPQDWLDDARRVRQAFERIKPDLPSMEKHLPDGEVINPDLLLDYLVQRRKEPSPQVRFYEKRRVRERDLAVQIVLDVSGSTGERTAEEPVIQIEQHAALLLGEGLAALGDRFAVCGFSSNGRKDCVYSVYKDFEDAWGDSSRGRVLAALPSNATRIGPALRHSQHRLAGIDARHRIVMLITDGKPRDNDGYDPQSRYAQHDVRMACEEGLRQGVATLGISTEQNTLADMEIMFPGRRFVILRRIGELPKLLPRLYLRATT